MTRVRPYYAEDHDEDHMARACVIARGAAYFGDRPFGCVIVDSDGKVVGVGSGTGTDRNPVRHSEIMAIQRASLLLDRPLEDCTLYSTHEPCIMCCGAILHAKIGRVVYGSHRSDLPDLFRVRSFSALDLLSETEVPPEVVSDGPWRRECIWLFTDDPLLERGERPA